MPKQSKLSIARLAAHSKRISFPKTKVLGFIEHTPDPPAIMRPSLSQPIGSVTTTKTIATTSTCGTQTDPINFTENFFEQSFSLFQAGSGKKVFPTNLENIALPFLLPYQYLCLLVLNLRFAMQHLFTKNTQLRKHFLKMLVVGLPVNQVAWVLGFSKKTFQRAMHPSLLPLHSLAANQKRNQSDLIFLHLSWPMLKRSLMSWLQLDLEKCTELFHVLSIVYMNSIVRLGITDESFASCFLQDFYL